MKKWVVEDWGFYIQRSERKIRNGYMVSFSFGVPLSGHNTDLL